MPKTVPACLTALGGRPLPETVAVGGRTYALRRVFKNDFFAVTAMYEFAGDGTGRGHAEGSGNACGERVLLKINRDAWFGPLPMRWVGRILVAKEVRALTLLADVEGVPKLLRRWGGTGLIREYVEGAPMCKGVPVGDGFHEQLRSLVAEIHARDMAYVDLEKCENVLVGADGRPYLFDFQISWYVQRRWGGSLWPVSGLRRWFQEADRYHLCKLQRRTRRDQVSPEQLAASYCRPWYIRVHRLLTWPFTWCRRRVLDRLDPRRRNGERGRVDEDVIGVM